MLEKKEKGSSLEGILPLNDMANALRILSIDMVETAKSGHPGLPLGAADIVTVLFAHFLKYDPTDSQWPDRDRFILSAGHGCALLYALYHCLGIEGLTLEELKKFRQLYAKVPGHPEYGHTPGVEMTTGPLGQGLASAVGMALAEKLLSQRFGEDLVNHKTYVLVSDGDLMEGVSHEAISLAGHYNLSKLIVLYDANNISIDGPLSLADSTHTLQRFQAANWHTCMIDGHSHKAIYAALEQAQHNDQPSLILCRTYIGYGAPKKQNCESAHGSPLGAEEVQGTRQFFHWEYPPFEIPPFIYQSWQDVSKKYIQEHHQWQKRVETLSTPLREEFYRRLAGDIPSDVVQALNILKQDMLHQPAVCATRKASGRILEKILPIFPALLGGSADLSDSTCVKTRHSESRFIHYGVREHAMAACMNGLALHKGFIPYGGTFLIFSDYLRPALRLSALMKQHVIYIMTHDSIGLGEDGPTHQPVEHLASLRSMPNLYLFRPADEIETLECWQLALSIKHAPSMLVLTRQDVSPLRSQLNLNQDLNKCAAGAYEIASASYPAQVTLLATGSEVEIALEAKMMLEEDNISTRVVSMPCWALFNQLNKKAREDILGMATLRYAIEAATSFGWAEYTSHPDCFIGLNQFGMSGKWKSIYEYFSITAKHVVRMVKRELN